jgi:hypothetical protein
MFDFFKNMKKFKHILIIHYVINHIIFVFLYFYNILNNTLVKVIWGRREYQLTIDKLQIIETFHFHKTTLTVCLSKYTFF